MLFHGVEKCERIFMSRPNFEENSDFVQRFRLSLQTVDYLDQRIGADISHDSLRNHALSSGVN